MNKTLQDVFQSAREQCVKAMLPYIIEKAVNNKIVFSPSIRVYFPEDSDEFFEDITELEYDEEENTWYVHNYITDTKLDVDEYWTPLRDLSFDELYKISERLQLHEG